MNDLTLDQSAADLLSFWKDAKGGKVLPDSEFIDPVKLRRWVGDISIVQLEEGEKRFFVTLHGSNVVRHIGPDFHQKYLEDVVPADVLANTTAPYDLSIKTNQPTYSIQEVTLDNGLFANLERLILPCTVDASETANRFLIWVAPMTRHQQNSEQTYRPLDHAHQSEMGIEQTAAPADLFLLTDEYLISNEKN